MQRRHPWRIFGSLSLLALLSLYLAVDCGSLSCHQLQAADSLAWNLRVPRATSAFVIGALLSLAGALLQLLLRNSLADPYVLGVSGGAATGAMLGAQFFPAVGISIAMQLGALGGALLSIFLLFVLAWRSLARLSLSTAAPGASLILTGVMISAGFGALITLLLTLSSDSTLRGTLFWLIGDLDVEAIPYEAMVVLLLATLWSIRISPQLNVLVHGDSVAQLLGIKVRRLRVMILLVASLATAAAVAVAGAIGFIGLVVPHMLRLWAGNDQRVLLPASVLAGGAALALADLAARVVLAPVQLPVGVVTALAGVPIFLYLLNRSRA